MVSADGSGWGRVVAVGVTQFTGYLLLVYRTSGLAAAPQLLIVLLEPARPPRTAGGLRGPWQTPTPVLLIVLHVVTSLYFIISLINASLHYALALFPSLETVASCNIHALRVVHR